MTVPEITVRGGGIFGLACAYELARRGARLRLIDPAGVAAGATGGLVGALSPHMPENWNPKKQFQLESLLAAEAFWAGVAAAGGHDPGYARSGRLQPLADAAAVAQAERRAGSAGELWRGAAVWRVVPASGAAWEPASPTGVLIHDTLSARLSPRQAAASLVAALRALGAEVIEGRDAPDHGLVLHATGWQGLTELGLALGRPVGSGVKGQAAAFQLAVADQPQLYAGGLHLVPHADGTVAVGSTSENTWATADAVDDQLEALIDSARALVPALTEAPVVERWAGIRPRARSRAPILGGWPGRPGHFIANGGFKIGFGMAPGVAAVMADLMLEGRDGIPDGFRVEDSLR
ncbi:FAD-binding oxidoreductase [Gemmobacter sp. JM10B15]|uniref:FAD-binding oxidoreductase n=2 Tax=Gemmobacter denitrificans TaxID=3123040 RepID=A0ABU8BTB6_9RHOB